MNNAQVDSSMNIVHAFSGHVGGAEVVHDVLLVAVLVVVLLHEGHNRFMPLYILKSFPSYFRSEYYFSSFLLLKGLIMDYILGANQPHSWTNEIVFHMSSRTSVP